jgi:iron-sulfur cluster assembly accessory protein
VAMPAPEKQLLNITDRALTKLSSLLKEKEGVIGIRIGVKSGGCSGLSYVIDYAVSQSAFDEIISFDKLTILIDKKAVVFIAGTQMDYIEEKFSSGFVFSNPLETARCGCGKSFSI